MATPTRLPVLLPSTDRATPMPEGMAMARPTARLMASPLGARRPREDRETRLAGVAAQANIRPVLSGPHIPRPHKVRRVAPLAGPVAKDEAAHKAWGTGVGMMCETAALQRSLQGQDSVTDPSGCRC